VLVYNPCGSALQPKCRAQLESGLLQSRKATWVVYGGSVLEADRWPIAIHRNRCTRTGPSADRPFSAIVLGREVVLCYYLVVAPK
jgi:hypothetical protein